MQKYYTKIPNEILEAFITRSFTSRQLRLLGLICRLTYGFHNRVAFFEKSYVKITGMYKGSIAKELRKLSELNVIMYDEEEKLICINLNIGNWKVGRNKNISLDDVLDLITKASSKQFRKRTILRTENGWSGSGFNPQSPANKLKETKEIFKDKLKFPSNY